MRSRLLPCLLPVIAVGIPAQTIHVVGPGALPEISSALAVASSGDIIHVLPGTYAPFSVGIGCTIRALSPGGVHVQALSAPASVTVAAPPGQAVHLAALDFSFPAGGNVVITGGRVTLDQCTVLGVGGLSSTSSPLLITNADVHLQGCTVSCSSPLGFGAAVQATSARITAIDSQFFGSPLGPSFFYVTSPAIDVADTTLHAAGCAFHSGTFGIGQVPALRATGGQVWLSDSTVVGFGACAIVATSVLADRCSVQPAYPTCPTLPSGGLLGVSRLQPMQHGAAFTLRYTTIPNGYVAIFASQELATLTIPGLHAQTQWLGAGVITLGALLADGAGQAHATWTLPAGAWLVDQPLWFQGLTGFALPLQLSPVAGGVIR